YIAQLTASGGTSPYAWTIISGSLPPGLSLSATGAIAGTPLLPGTYSFTVQVTDQLTAAATAALSITITAGALAVTTTSVAPASLGAAYTAALQASGGTGAPYSWTIIS